MKKITYIFILVFFICCNKGKIDETKSKANNLELNNLDKAFIDLKSKKFDTVIRKQLKNLAIKCVHNNKNYLEIYKYIDEQSNTIDDQFGRIEANTNLGIYFYTNFQNDSAFYYYSKAEKISKGQKGNPFMGTILQSKADIFWCQKNFTEAESKAISALRIALKKKNNELTLSCYITIANSLAGLNKDQEGLDYYKKAIQKVDGVDFNTNKLAFKALIFNYIALIYQKQNEYKKSLIYSQKGLSLEDFATKDPKLFCYITNTISYSKFKLGDKSSLNQFQETLKIGDSIKSIPIQITSKTYLGECYLAQKDTLKANFYLKQAQVQAHANAIFEDELKILKLLGLANPNEEFFYSNKYIELNDSLQSVERATRDKFARIEFETDEISSHVNVVEKKNNQLLYSIWVILGISLLAIILIYLIYKNQSQLAKTRELLLKQEQKVAEEEIFQLMIDQQNKIEEGKNTEKQRISLDLHDNVMGKLAAVRLNLYFELSKEGIENKESFDNLSKQIQAVEIEIRDIAHNLNTNLFSNNASFVEIVKELFAKIENHSTIKFTLDVSNNVNWDAINNDIKINLYRIIQEALQNIEKYANASSVTISIMQMENQLMLEIADNGKGFNTHSRKEGIGIKNMKTRAIAIKGKITIDSKINSGTKINLTVTV